MAKVNPLSGLLDSSDEREEEAAPPRSRRRQGGAPARPPKPVRVTLDLPPSRHAELQRWCLDAAPEVGTARVANQRVLSALVGRLLTDERLSRQIMRDLRKAAQEH